MFAVVVLGAVGFYLNNQYCSFVKEIKAYVVDSDTFYYYGERYCPATWAFDSIDIDSMDELSSTEDIVVISKDESTELETALNDKYLSYTRYTAGSEEEQFIIYETECQKCKN